MMQELQYTDADVAFVRNYFQVSEAKIKENVDILKQWIAQQRHLPKNQSDGFLERQLLRNKFRIEQTKLKLEAYYTLRGIYREYYQENNEDITPSQQTYIWIPLPRLTPKSERIYVVRLEDYDPESYDLVEVIRCFMLVLEIVMRNDYCVGDKVLCDMKGVAMGHLTKLSVAKMSQLHNLYLKAYSARPITIDFINSPTYINLFMKIYKLAFSEKLFSKIKLHEDLETIYETYPKECLPKDYGGELESLAKIKEKWDVVFEKNQHFFNACYHDVSQEHLRVGELPKRDYFGVDGTFKQLTLD